MYKAGNKFVQLLKNTKTMANIEQEAMDQSGAGIEDE